jgi:hypothetical protein
MATCWKVTDVIKGRYWSATAFAAEWTGCRNAVYNQSRRPASASPSLDFWGCESPGLGPGIVRLAATPPRPRPPGESPGLVPGIVRLAAKLLDSRSPTPDAGGFEVRAAACSSRPAEQSPARGRGLSRGRHSVVSQPTEQSPAQGRGLCRRGYSVVSELAENPPTQGRGICRRRHSR